MLTIRDKTRLDLLDYFPRYGLWMCERLSDVINRTAQISVDHPSYVHDKGDISRKRQSLPFQSLTPFRRRFLPQHPFDQPDDFRPILHPSSITCEPLVSGPIWSIE